MSLAPENAKHHTVIVEELDASSRVIDVLSHFAAQASLSFDVIDGVVVLAADEEDRGSVVPRVYNVEKLLSSATSEELAERLMHLESVSTEWTEFVGPLLIVRTDFETDQRIQSQIASGLKSRENDVPADIEVYGDARSSIRLLLPKRGQAVPNGNYTRTKLHTWFFDWEDVPKASRYHLIVQSATAPNPVVDQDNIRTSEWNYVSKGFVSDQFRHNWTWKVRALVDDEWTDWSEVRRFSVMPIE